jgi:hypothetical protein
LDNSALLVQASSGLERMMHANQNGVLKDSTVAQISAFVYYEAAVISKLTTNKQFQNAFTTVMFDQINTDFGNYIDALARSKPKSLHHVYEWKKTGNKAARLFKLNKISEQGLSFRVNYDFLPSRSMVPSSNSRRRHMFENKAIVMEEGNPLVIRPKNSDRLVFEIDGETVFMPKGAPVTVRRPGGSAARNQFTLAHSRFFSGRLVNESIKRSGFQRIFNSSMTKALRVPSNIKKVQYSFSANTIRSQADSALALSFGGAM